MGYNSILSFFANSYIIIVGDYQYNSHFNDLQFI